MDLIFDSFVAGVKFITSPLSYASRFKSRLRSELLDLKSQMIKCDEIRMLGSSLREKIMDELKV
jgi:hypothetical protein